MAELAAQPSRHARLGEIRFYPYGAQRGLRSAVTAMSGQRTVRFLGPMAGGRNETRTFAQWRRNDPRKQSHVFRKSMQRVRE